jgi:predicted Zn-dependent protease
MKSRASFFLILFVLAATLLTSAFSQENQQSTSTSGGQPAQASDQQNGAPTQQPQIKHEGGKDDVNAIGTRKLGGLDWYSWDKEIQLGNALAKQLEMNAKMIDDPVINEYVNRIGQNLVRNSDVKIPVTIKILDDDSPNAVTLPGGHLYVNSGLLLAAEEEDEVAGVMAHEIGHIAARHGTRGATRAQLASLLRLPAIFIPGGVGILVGQGIGVGLPVALFKFSRGFEAEADYLGIEYMYKAGYDPAAMITFFEKLEALEKKKPGTLDKLFATHPQTPDRAEKSQEEIATILPPRDQYIVTTSEFNDVKARMMALHDGHKPQDHKDSNTPTLRRSPGATSPDGKDDDRSVLKKRD